VENNERSVSEFVLQTRRTRICKSVFRKRSCGARECISIDLYARAYKHISYDDEWITKKNQTKKASNKNDDIFFAVFIFPTRVTTCRRRRLCSPVRPAGVLYTNIIIFTYACVCVCVRTCSRTQTRLIFQPCFAFAFAREYVWLCARTCYISLHDEIRVDRSLY